MTGAPGNNGGRPGEKWISGSVVWRGAQRKIGQKDNTAEMGERGKWVNMESKRKSEAEWRKEWRKEMEELVSGVGE